MNNMTPIPQETETSKQPRTLLEAAQDVLQARGIGYKITADGRLAVGDIQLTEETLREMADTNPGKRIDGNTLRSGQAGHLLPEELRTQIPPTKEQRPGLGNLLVGDVLNRLGFSVGNNEALDTPETRSYCGGTFPLISGLGENASL